MENLTARGLICTTPSGYACRAHHLDRISLLFSFMLRCILRDGSAHLRALAHGGPLVGVGGVVTPALGVAEETD
eukprot:119274-Pleurochrysis_carterae.AAC.1